MNHRLRLVATLLLGATACADLVGIEDRSYKEPDSEPAVGTTVAADTSSSADASSSTTSSPSSTDATTGGSTGGNGTGGGGGGGSGGGGAGSGGAPCSDDLDDDPENCGTCGHDCLGGDCEGGACQPVLISGPLPGDPYKYRSLVVDADPNGEVYFARWVPGGTVYRVAKEPSSTPVVVHAIAGAVSDVQIDHDWIYFSNYSDTDVYDERGVYVLRRSGGTPVQLVRGGWDLFGTSAIQVDRDRVFFTTYFGSIAIGAADFGGGPIAPLWYLGDAPPYYQSGATIVLDDDWVYSGSVGVGVSRYRKDGSATELVEARAGNAVVSCVADGWVYYQADATTLRRVRADGSERSVPITTGAAAAMVHGDHLYTVQAGGTELRRVPLADLDGPSELLATAAPSIGSIAVDAVSLFYMSYGTGEIHRVALPGSLPPASAPSGWTCLDEWFGDGASCDCGCGIPDPDCLDETRFIYGCGRPHQPGEGVACIDGGCEVGLDWTCRPEDWADGAQCDCDCGAPDPDCDFGSLPITGCPAGTATCRADACVDDDGWTCGPERLGTGDGCDCSCGAYDPDCDDAGAGIYGCGPLHAVADGPTCLSDGGCEAPAEWACAGDAFDDFGSCDCGCGAPDPDCIVDRELPVPACGGGQRCPADACVDVAPGDTCDSAELLTEGTFAGSFATVVGDYDHPGGGSCALYGTPGRDITYRVDLEAGQSVDITVDPGPGVDVALYLVTSCNDVVADCVAAADSGLNDQPDTVSFTAAAATTLYLVVDQYHHASDGPFTLTATFDP